MITMVMMMMMVWKRKIGENIKAPKSLPAGALINQLPDTAAKSESLGSHVLLIRSEGWEPGEGSVGRQGWESEMKSPRRGISFLSKRQVYGLMATTVQGEGRWVTGRWVW